VSAFESTLVTVYTSSAPSKSAETGFLRLAIAGEAGLLLLAWGLGRWINVSPLQELHPSVGGILWGLIATAPLLLGLWWMLNSSLSSIRRLVALVVTQLGPLLNSLSMAGLAGLACIAGIAEEVLFRGLIQPGLTPWLTPWGALLVSSVLFGLVHFASRAYAAFATVMGLYLGAVLLLVDNLLAPIVTHGAYDFVALVYVARRYRNSYAPQSAIEDIPSSPQ
jgi:membrane protease YdiL (CAAX protease family)